MAASCNDGEVFDDEGLHELAQELGRVDGVTAVVLGGSRARGDHKVVGPRG